MNMDEIRNQAMEQLSSDYELLATLSEGEECDKVVARINTLTKLLNEQDKTNWDYDARITVSSSEAELKTRELDIREKELELKAKELENRASEQKTDAGAKILAAVVPVALTSVVSLVTLCVYCSQSAKWMKFEETGTATSQISKGLIGKLFK